VTVTVHGSGLRLPDAELADLVEVCMERELERRPAVREALLYGVTASTSLVWHVDRRFGRPEATSIVVESFEGDHRLGDDHSLIVGPNDAALRSELALAIARLTLRIAQDRHEAEVRMIEAKGNDTLASN
jgi:hypothetical protein